MSGAAINIIVAPWFQRRRGLALSAGFNGATSGGVIIAANAHSADRGGRPRSGRRLRSVCSRIWSCS